MFYKLRWLLWPQLGLVVLVTTLAYLGKIPLRFLALPYADKVMHFLLFGLVAFWLSFWRNDQITSFWKRNLPVLILFVPIITEECLQSLSPYRTFDFQDMGCDLAGVLLFWTWGHRFSRRD